MLHRGAKLLQSKMEQHAGVDVTYRRGNEFTFQLRVVPGRNPVEITDTNGMVLRGQVQDFSIDVSTFENKVPSGAARPKRGDEIVMTVGRHQVVFTVNGEDFATSHYESSDSYGVAWRVHTKSERIL